MHQLRNHVPNLFAASHQVIRHATLHFHFHSMKPLAKIIRKREHFLKRARQLRQVFKPVTPRAELRPSERFRSRSDGVYAVTFNAIEPWRVGTSCDVPAALEKLERLAMTSPAHRKRSRSVRSGHEFVGVGFELLRLRRITAVTTGAPDVRFAVSAGLIDRHDS